MSNITPDNTRHINEITNTKKIDNEIKRSVEKSKKDYNTSHYQEEKIKKQNETTKKRLATLAKKKEEQKINKI